MSSAKTASRTVKTTRRPCSGSRAEQQQVAEPERDPGGAEHRRGDRDRGRLARLGDAVEQEREQQREDEAAEHPRRPAELRAEQRRERARVAGEHERPQPARHHVELVQRDERRDEREAEEPPAAQPDEPEHDGHADDRDEEPRDELVHRPPNRRRRLAYSSSACRSSASPKSGQSVSTKTSSAYASCQRKKFERRSSPEVRISRSGSGRSGAYRRAASASSSTSAGATPSSTSRRAASTISARPP